MEVVKDILSGGNSSRLKLLGEIEVEASRSSIPMIQEQTRENLKPLIRLFDEFVSKAKESIGYELKNVMRVTDYLIVTYEQILFTPDAEVAIDEHCSIYIDAEEQMKIYEAANEAASALNKLQKLTEPFGLNALGERGLIHGERGLIHGDMTVCVEALSYCKPDGLFVGRH
jgi:hypothetical protein